MKHPSERILDEYEELLQVMRSCVTDGFQEYQIQYAAMSAKHHARTRASTIHDHIISLAKERLAQFPDVRFLQGCIRNLFDVDGKMIVQFRKLGSDLLTSNYPTELALGFDNQDDLCELPDIPPRLPRLTVGYVPSGDWTSIHGIYITYRVGEELIWFRDITETGGEITAIPMQPMIVPPQETERRVYPKGKRKSGGLDNAAEGV